MPEPVGPAPVGAVAPTGPATLGRVESPRGGRGGAEERAAGVALALGVAAWVAIYVWLYVHGVRFFVMKTAVMPVFVLYAVLLRNRGAFLSDWLPFLSGTVLFDAIRGAIYVLITHGHLHVFSAYVRWMEHALCGVFAAPAVLQHWRSPVLDAIAVSIHASHFAYFLLFGLILWHTSPRHFDRLRDALLLVMAIGLVVYALVPTVPPWLAFEDLHMGPPVVHIAGRIYTGRLPELYGTFDTNPVAAMPSLHVAFPLTCALIGWRAYGRRVGWWLVAYAALVAAAAVYLGEHYAVDVLAGVATAVVAGQASRRPLVGAMSLRRSFLVSSAALAVTWLILAASR
jgi:membrane-associated phospholipid phosphatase